MASVFAAIFVVVARAFAPFAASAAGVSALLVAFCLHRRSAAQSSDGPGPVSAGVSAVPVPVSKTTFPAVAGISGLASHPPCLKELDVLVVEDHWDGPRFQDAEHCCFLKTDPSCCSALLLVRDSTEDCRVLLPLSRVPRRDH